MFLYSAAINIKNEHAGLVDKDFSYGLSVTLLITTSAYLIFGTTFVVYFHKKEKLSGEKQKKTCGYLYQDLNYEKEGWGALLYPLLCNLRLIMLVYVTLYMQEYMVLQVFLMSLSTIYMVHILSSK